MFEHIIGPFKFQMNMQSSVLSAQMISYDPCTLTFPINDIPSSPQFCLQYNVINLNKWTATILC